MIETVPADFPLSEAAQARIKQEQERKQERKQERAIEKRERKRLEDIHKTNADFYYTLHPEERPLVARLTGNLLGYPKQPPPDFERSSTPPSASLSTVPSIVSQDPSVSSNSLGSNIHQPEPDMALAPKFAGQALSNSLGSNHTLELCT